MDPASFYQLCAWASTSFFIVCFMPQVYTTLKDKNVEGQNPLTWMLLIGAYSTGLIFSLGTWQPPLIANFGIGGLLALIMLVSCYKFRRPTKKGVLKHESRS